MAIAISACCFAATLLCLLLRSRSAFRRRQSAKSRWDALDAADSRPESYRERMDAEKASAQTVKGAKALVAEDNALNQEYFAFALKEHGVESDVVSDGIQALEAFRRAEEGTYDYIFMDVMMPRMNGLEAARAIRGLPGRSAKTVPIIAMTANAFQQDIQDCLDAGMSDHLAKPLNPEDLARKLEKYRHADTTDEPSI